MLVSQLAIIVAILWMGMTNPVESSTSLTTMALAAVLLGFSSATQDVVIDAATPNWCLATVVVCAI